MTLCIFISTHFCTRFNAWTKRWFLSGVFRRDLTINRESIQRENKGNRDDSREISAFLFSFFSVVFYAVFRYVILIFVYTQKLERVKFCRYVVSVFVYLQKNLRKCNFADMLYQYLCISKILERVQFCRYVVSGFVYFSKNLRECNFAVMLRPGQKVLAVGNSGQEKLLQRYKNHLFLFSHFLPHDLYILIHLLSSSQICWKYHFSALDVIINENYCLKMNVKGGSGCPHIESPGLSSLIILTFVGTNVLLIW